MSASEDKGSSQNVSSEARRRELRREKILTSREKRMDYILGKADQPTLSADDKPSTPPPSLDQLVEIASSSPESKFSKYVRRSMIVLLALAFVLFYSDLPLISKLYYLSLSWSGLEFAWWCTVAIVATVTRCFRGGKSKQRSVPQSTFSSALAAFDIVQAMFGDFYALMLTFGMCTALAVFVTNIT